MLKKCKTLYQEGLAERIEKKSKFLAVAKPIASELEAQKTLEALRKKHWDASHTVFAYRIGARNEIQRYSDDGEPPGTAGMPVLDVLRGQEIQNAFVAVTRYFGGVLLGTGGLVRAYGHSAAQAVEDALVIEKTPYQALHVATDYGSFGKIQYAALQSNHLIQEVSYTDKVDLVVYVPEDAAEGFLKELIDLTAGQAVLKKGETLYGAFINGKHVMLKD